MNTRLANIGAAGLVFVGVLALMVSCAEAFFADGNTLHHQCQNNRQGAIGLVVGASNLYMSIDPNWRYCIPSNATSGQLTDTVCRMVGENPEIRHMPAGEITIGTISNTWGCAGQF